MPSAPASDELIAVLEHARDFIIGLGQTGDDWPRDPYVATAEIDALLARLSRAEAPAADARPLNCRFRQQDEGKAYPRSACAHCGKTITTGLGRKCEFGSPPAVAAAPAAGVALEAVGEVLAEGVFWYKPAAETWFPTGTKVYTSPPSSAAEIATLREQVTAGIEEEQRLIGRLNTASFALDAAAAKERSLRENLEPFAKKSRTLHSGYDDGIAAGDNPYVSVPVKDLRAAEAALTAGERRDDAE